MCLRGTVMHHHSTTAFGAQLCITTVPQRSLVMDQLSTTRSDNMRPGQQASFKAGHMYPSPLGSTQLRATVSPHLQKNVAEVISPCLPWGKTLELFMGVFAHGQQTYVLSGHSYASPQYHSAHV